MSVINFLTRTAAATLINASIIYLVLIAAMLVFARGEGGLLMFSPVAFAVFALWIPALFCGLQNGLLIASVPVRYLSFPLRALLLSASAGIFMAAYTGLLILVDSGNEDSGRIWLSVVLFFACVVANLVTIAAVKRIFYSDQAPNL